MGSIGSLVVVVVSSVGLGFAILQIIRLRGETRAASEKTEEILPPVDVARRASLAVKAAVEVEAFQHELGGGSHDLGPFVVG